MPIGNQTDKKISVLLIDDSSFIRVALNKMLSAAPEIEIVGSVTNGQSGVDTAKIKQPDIIILDIEMPIMDGLTALPLIREVSPRSKVVMFSSLTEKGAEATMKAFQLGAVECVAKPSSHSMNGQEDSFESLLIRLIRSLMGQSEAVAMRSTTVASAAPSVAPTAPIAPAVMAPVFTGKPDIVAIGSSTGGPQALFTVLKECGGFNVPIVITQHMPATFTKILADHITNQTPLECHEGEDGMILEAGHAYVAPGGKHMLFQENEHGSVVIKLDDGPAVNFCKPAVDPMINSLIALYGKRILNVILTGMGHDGRDAAIELAKLGGRVVAQDKATSVVWGMPGAVAEAGICQEILPLETIGPWIRRAVLG